MNPELELIDVLAGQIQDDERILDGLGGGRLSLEDLERWHRRRWEAEKRFLKETGRLIAEMRGKGFGSMMRRSRVQTFGQSKRRGASPPKKAGRRLRRSPPPQPHFVQPRFTLELAELGLPCTLLLAGTYDDVVDAGVWHARHVHRVRGSVASLRDLIKSGIVEQQTGRAALGEFGDRSEQQVSDEAANRTRSSGYASA